MQLASTSCIIVHEPANGTGAETDSLRIRVVRALKEEGPLQMLFTPVILA